MIGLQFESATTKSLPSDVATVDCDVISARASAEPGVEDKKPRTDALNTLLNERKGEAHLNQGTVLISELSKAVDFPEDSNQPCKLHVMRVYVNYLSRVGNRYSKK